MHEKLSEAAAEQRAMQSLFPTLFENVRVPGIAGLSYVPQYVSKKEELDLQAAIDAEKWDTSWDRRRQPYGASYGSGRTDLPPIPLWGRTLADRMLHDRIAERPFDQMLVNEYLPRQGIAFHRDYDPFDRTVVSLSLLAPCVMDFRLGKRGRHESILLEPRSLLILRDEARYEWAHGIARRKHDRWNGMTIPRARRLSVTFRSLKDS